MEKNETIFSQGDSCEGIFYICSGDCKVAVLSEQGKEAVVALHGKGDFFGAAVADGAMPGDPTECRENAKECLSLAAQASSPLAQAQFEELAKRWIHLAADIERSKALLAQWGDPSLKKTG